MSGAGAGGQVEGDVVGCVQTWQTVCQDRGDSSDTAVTPVQ